MWRAGEKDADAELFMLFVDYLLCGGALVLGNKNCPLLVRPRE